MPSLRICINLLVMAFFLATGTAAQASICCCMKPAPAKTAQAEESDCHKMAAAKHEKSKTECCCEKMMGCKSNLGKATLRALTENDLAYTKTQFFVEQFRFTSIHPALLQEPPKA